MKDSTYKKYCLMIDEWFVNGRNGTKAYQKFYPDASPETAVVEFSKILTIPNISEYVKEKEENTSERLNITFEKQLERLDYIIDTAEKEADKINAIKEQNKLLALYEEHNRQRGDIKLDGKVSIGFTKKR